MLSRFVIHKTEPPNPMVIQTPWGLPALVPSTCIGGAHWGSSFYLQVRRTCKHTRIMIVEA